ncbi:hypothetical protein NIES4072_70100 [Nostoc commune NIES-4072]|uniref:Uncharacterized protein n=1 Tax=Nostoc commune NIES-4072 TaxID=2005467 RepID=A0A2R5G0R0_NOSCO|nr:hypothetical protein [Nostoc commune]BBD70643.1 hypothetical protein NIES4070_70540 [Nostoc commune HK-02]GBG23298.1 hypothetical protein NIES4072_70100 [Nostoc commune NIES-4072]
MTHSITKTQDPLTSRDRTIIAHIINQSDYPHKCQSEHVITIWINDDVVWVKMTHGYARFNKIQFKAAVAHFKQVLETPRERNDRLSQELETACKKFKLWHGQIDWLSFGCKLFQDKELMGVVGYNERGWYCRRRQYGPSQQVLTIDDAITLLGVKVAAA